MRSQLRCAAAAFAATLVSCNCSPPTPEPGSRLGRDVPRPTVLIESPLDNALIAAAGLVARVDVSGTVSADAITVSVKGIDAELEGGRFLARDVPLREGDNVLVAQARNAEGTGTSIVIVRVDRTAPHVTVTLPAAGSSIVGDRVTVIGGVTDLVTGGAPQEISVSVNGVTAVVANHEFVARDVPLPPGAQQLRAIAKDLAGNTSEASVSVTARQPEGQTLTGTAGVFQDAVVGAEAGTPLEVTLKDPLGAPMPGRRVRFEVVRGSGQVISGSKRERSLIVKSDASGKAVSGLALSTRMGVAANLVRATARGFDGDALFIVRGTAGPALRLVAEEGDNQLGPPLERLPRPLGVKVLDEAGNAVSGATARFEVTAGGGTLTGGSSTFSAQTDFTGRAWVVLTLGPDESLTGNVVEATFDGNAGAPVRFQAAAIFPGVVEETRVAGEVLSMTQQPIAGLDVRVIEAVTEVTQRARTDESGRFFFTGVPPGLVTIAVDPSTLAGEAYPTAMSFDLVAMSGRLNKLPRPIYLPKLDVAGGIEVDESTGGTLKMADMPELELVVAPGSATFLDGSKRGRLSLTQVNNERIPMSPPGGVGMQIVGALQPAGTRFDPPARLRYPNLDGLPAGQVVDIMTFDHDMNRFVTVGTGQVSEDGKTMLSDLGQGMPFAGWHGFTPPAPQPQAVDGGMNCALPCQTCDTLARCPSPACGPAVATAVERVCKDKKWPSKLDACFQRLCFTPGAMRMTCPPSPCGFIKGDPTQQYGACTWDSPAKPGKQAQIGICGAVTAAGEPWITHGVFHEMLHACGIPDDSPPKMCPMGEVTCPAYPIPVPGCGPGFTCGPPPPTPMPAPTPTPPPPPK